MKYIIIIAALSLTVEKSYSQTSRKGIHDDPIVKERLANNGQRIKADVKISEYFGLEEQIKNLLTESTIPADCPKSTTGFTSKTEYVKAVNSWLINNPSKKRSDKKDELLTE